MNQTEPSLLSPARAAQVAGVPTWVVLTWLRCGALTNQVRVKGSPRVRADELRIFLTNHKPRTAK